MPSFLRPMLMGLVLAAMTACASQPLPQASAESVGMNGQKLESLHGAMRRYVDDHTVAGVVTLVGKDGKIVCLNAEGMADIESHRPMTTDTMFRIASMTKPITATALMILVDEGKVSIDDPVSQYIPSFADARTKNAPVTRPITLKDCLTHTSGLGGSQIFEGTLGNNADELAARTLLFQPGEKWSYSPGLNVIGRVVELVAHQPFGDFVEQRIFTPLGMNSTTFSPTEAQWERVATVYKPGETAGTLAPVTSGWSSQLGKVIGPQPSGGLFSTASDLASFYQMILNGGKLNGKRIVSEESVTQMTRIQTGDQTVGFTPGNGWGLGWCVLRKPEGVTASLSPGTYGHGGAFGTQGWVDPETRMIYILLIQREGLPNADGSSLRKDFHTIASQAVLPNR